MRGSHGRLWKWLGLAGLAGVAATGVLVARDERRRRAYSPDDVRARLHERLERAEREPAGPARDEHEQRAPGRAGSGSTEPRDGSAGHDGSPTAS